MFSLHLLHRNKLKNQNCYQTRARGIFLLDRYITLYKFSPEGEKCTSVHYEGPGRGRKDWRYTTPNHEFP